MRTLGRVLSSALCLSLISCGATADGADGESPGTAQTQDIRACDLVTLSAATTVLGSGTEHPGGDTEPDTCIYLNEGIAMLTVQVNDASWYDQTSILPPHSELAVGDRGRYSIPEGGPIAVEFVEEGRTVTMGVRQIGTGEGSYLEPLLALARQVARELRGE